jgi:molybdate transport system substrate-binding protein
MQRLFKHTLAALALILPTDVFADDLRLIGVQSIKIIMNEVGPVFEKQIGMKIDLSADLVVAAKARIDAGENFDVAILTPLAIDQLIREGKIAADTRADILRVGIGVAVRAGAPRPDISSVEAFKQALLTAKSLAWLNGSAQGGSGAYLRDLVQRLGIAEAVRAKTKLLDTDTVGPLIARGEAELGITAIATLLATPGVDVIGEIPAEIQFYVAFTGGVSPHAKWPKEARELIRFLKGPTVLPVMKAHGMIPG